jgi:hypothetical protein
MHLRVCRSGRTIITECLGRRDDVDMTCDLELQGIRRPRREAQHEGGKPSASVASGASTCENLAGLTLAAVAEFKNLRAVRDGVPNQSSMTRVPGNAV